MKKFFVFIVVLSVFFSCLVPAFAATENTAATETTTETGLKPVVEIVNATVLKLKKAGARRRALVEYNGKRYGAELSPETWIELVPGDTVTVVVPTEWAVRAYHWVYEPTAVADDGSWHVTGVVTNSAAYYAVVSDGNNTKKVEVPKNLPGVEIGEKVEFTKNGELKYYESWRSTAGYFGVAFLAIMLIGSIVFLIVLLIKDKVR